MKNHERIARNSDGGRLMSVAPSKFAGSFEEETNGDVTRFERPKADALQQQFGRNPAVEALENRLGQPLGLANTGRYPESFSIPEFLREGEPPREASFSRVVPATSTPHRSASIALNQQATEESEIRKYLTNDRTIQHTPVVQQLNLAHWQIELLQQPGLRIRHQVELSILIVRVETAESQALG
ncbi:hypothetical protein SISNIDRAFT_467093 [Sistotremastrum niveocremeum HHB9708]|uniref:Uncharacterized protein n=1 Tax=Sistotremastrum niveocremeum HHB9708 TaxID=1314777 RepID=A0A164TC86_9AGAM|nr:hypothetical protein SISNIDRAFT_467093 [Sistotremastrum niveocremeum HHB9708]